MVAAFARQARRERRRKQHRLASRAWSGASEDVWRMLDYFSQEVAEGRDIAPYLQKAVNAVVAPALAAGKLPKKKIGRPISKYELERQRRIAASVAALRAQGRDKGEAVDIVAGREERDVRTVYQHVRRHKTWVDRQEQKAGMLADYWAGAAPVLQAVVRNLAASDLRRAMEDMRECLRKYGDDVPLFRRARKLIDSD